MAEQINRGDRDQCSKQPRRDGSGLDAVRVETQRHEADADVEGFAWDLVLVDEVPVMAV